MRGITFNNWLARYENDLLDQWDSGVYLNGREITEKTYSEFRNNMWKEFQDSEGL